jgi:hypothetical protein
MTAPTPDLPTPALLDDLTDPVLDLHDVAARRGFSRRRMARWTQGERASATIDELIDFADRRAELLLATGRAQAVRALVGLTRLEGDKTRETVRKACLDLIKLNTGWAPTPPAPGAPGGAPDGDDPAPTAEEIAAAVESLAQYAEAQEDPGAEGGD